MSAGAQAPPVPDPATGSRSRGALPADRLVGTVRRSAAMTVLVVVILLGGVLFGDSFLSTRNLLNIALGSSFLAIVSVGMTFVIVSGGIDLSVGSVMALAAVLTAFGSQRGSVVAIALPLVVCALVGLVNGLLIGRARMAPFIITLASLLFARGLAFAVSDNGNVTYLIEPGMAVTRLGQARVLGIGLPLLIALAVFAIGMVVLNRTAFGQAVIAIGGSEEAAEQMGIRVGRIKVALYTLSGLLAGLAGLLVAARSSSGLSTIGSGLELEAIAAVVIGGTLLTGGRGSLIGTLAGVMLLGAIQNLINQVGTLDTSWQQVVSGVFLVVVVVAQTALLRRARR
jgi:ribose/xylose/arabinose/galactoside ABC-type transport system permease subunit